MKSLHNSDDNPSPMAADTGASTDLENVPLMRSKSLRDQIYERIRGMIVSGALRPEETINEVAIAKSLGISRTPVREAVKRLGDEGLVKVLAQSGTYVTALSVRDIQEAYMIRSALEAESARHAAGRISEQQIEGLRDIIAAHELANQRGRVGEAIMQDDSFHRTIAEVSGFQMLWRAVDICKAQMDRGRFLAIPAPGNAERTIAEHRQILKALERHDAEAAVLAIRQHLANSLRDTVAAVASSQI